MVIHAASDCQHARMVQVRPPEFWSRTRMSRGLDGHLKVAFRFIPPTIEGGSDPEDAREQTDPSTRKKDTALYCHCERLEWRFSYGWSGHKVTKFYQGTKRG
jgi:hypothetical protein